MLYYSRGNEHDNLNADDLKQGLYAALEKLGKRQKVLALPPDITRLHSRAGELTRYAWQYYGEAMTDVLPALGTHFAMTEPEIEKMFGDVPAGLFRVHDWRNGFATLGEVPSSFIREVSEGKLDWSWPAQVSRLIAEGGHDLILSIGQVVPHEVIGMANYNKNVFVGTGGSEGINKSHFLGACYGMERIMGRADTPVRRVLNYASDHFAKHLPIVYVLTVVGATQAGQVTRGLFIGDDIECFNKACELSLKVNFTMLDEPLKKVVVYLDPEEFKSTWLGNKSIYRTRMAMADGGELIVLAPGLKEFGEDKEIDRLIRKYGYVGTAADPAAGPGQRRTAANLERRRPPDPRLVRGPLHGHLLPGPHHAAGDRERELPIRRPADDDGQVRPDEAAKTASTPSPAKTSSSSPTPAWACGRRRDEFK